MVFIIFTSAQPKSIEANMTEYSEREKRMKAKTYKGKSLKKGGGGKFAKMTDALKKKGISSARAKAIAAASGRRKYGKAEFQRMATAGRKRAKRVRKGGGK
jgi:hypothetical protein